MNRKLVIASAGAGKTHQIITESKSLVENGDKVLVITYTENNQKELFSRFRNLKPINPTHFVVKGLFSFLLEDIIRPYQSCLFNDRIESINFNQADPHKRNGRTIPGRSEINPDKTINPDYYLTKCRKKAHTTYLAKLASRITKKSDGRVLDRLERIYSHIFFDEVQDLVGWDYEVIKALVKSKSLSIACVGDFRQTIYDTSVSSKTPKNSEQKINSFTKMKFVKEDLAVSYRSVQEICDYSDQVHADAGYCRTISMVKKIPDEVKDHIGIFAVKESDIDEYITRYNPVLLRYSKSSGKKLQHYSLQKVNFGKSKGLSFDRTLILPTKSYLKFIMGDRNVFSKDKTDESKNKLYVSISRARYSAAFLVPDKKAEKCDLNIWKKG